MRAQSDQLAAELAAQGTEVCFGIPGGGANLALIGACELRGIRFVLMRGETAAVIAAGVYGELTGRPGLAIVTRGPGLASAANGIAQAWLDRQPVIVATDGTGTAYSHQRIDHAQLAAPIAKAVVADPGEAVKLALALPQGPVVVDVGAPRTVSAGVRGRAAARTTTGTPAGARRPLVIAGVAARGAEGALRELVRGSAIPVLTTYKAKGAIPESWPNAAGLFTGATIEGPLLAEADLIVLVGVDPVELIPAGWPYPAPVLSLSPWQIDDDYLPVSESRVGPLPALLAELDLDGSGWQRAGDLWRTAAAASVRVATPGLAPHVVIEAVRAAVPARSIATVDAGAHMLVAMPLWSVEEPRSCLISSGLATMGFALPAAIAAALTTTDPVVCLTGDGGLGMCLAELETVARIGRDIRVVVLDDAALSLIEIKQTAGQGGRSAVRHGAVDFAALATALGVPGTTASTAAEIARAVSQPGPSLVHARVDASGYAAVLAAVRG